MKAKKPKRVNVGTCPHCGMPLYVEDDKPVYLCECHKAHAYPPVPCPIPYPVNPQPICPWPPYTSPDTATPPNQWPVIWCRTNTGGG